MASIRTQHVPGKPALCVDVAGTGETVFLLHGIGGNRTNWSDQVRRYGDEFRAIAWDARGYNGSEDYDGPLDFSDFSRDLARCLDHFGARKAHLVGLSMGGRIIQDFHALFADRIATLTIVASMSGFKNLSEAERRRFVDLRKKPLTEDGKEPRDIAPIVAKTLCGPNVSAENYQRMVASMAALHKDSYVKTVEASIFYDRTIELERIAVPTLLVFAEHDTLTRPEMGEAMHRRIKGSEFAVIKDSGHLVNIEQRDAFDAVVLPFLRKHRKLAA